MGLLIFLAVVLGLPLLLFFCLALGGLFFGGEDPYERELREYDRNDDLCDALRANRGGDTYVDIDARSVHLHKS